MYQDINKFQAYLHKHIFKQKILWMYKKHKERNLLESIFAAPIIFRCHLLLAIQSTDQLIYLEAAHHKYKL